MITTETSGSALYTALAYHRAWTSHDFDQAMTYIAPESFCHAPPDQSSEQPRSAASWARSHRP